MSLSVDQVYSVNPAGAISDADSARREAVSLLGKLDGGVDGAGTMMKGIQSYIDMRKKFATPDPAKSEKTRDDSTAAGSPGNGAAGKADFQTGKPKTVPQQAPVSPGNAITEPGNLQAGNSVDVNQAYTANFSTMTGKIQETPYPELDLSNGMSSAVNQIMGGVA